jgi:hypothetical protein
MQETYLKEFGELRIDSLLEEVRKNAPKLDGDTLL